MAERKRFLDFITEVARNPEQLKKIAKNPDHELSAAGLDPEEVEALKSQDADRIRQLLVKEGSVRADAPTITITAVIKF